MSADAITSNSSSAIEEVAIEIPIVSDSEVGVTTTTEESSEKPGEDEAETPVVQAPPPSINDENAFPALGGSTATSTSSPISWGPTMKTVSPTPSTANGSFKAPKRSTIQEAFNIKSAASVTLPKAEFAKLINDLKKAHSVSIESTLSSITKDRSFIVSGKPTDALKVKRELLRHLTKPVKVTFKIPSKTRSAIIGAGGRNLKPVIEATSCKIDIERQATPSSDSDDLDDLIEVVLEGDAEGCQIAKKMITEIVDEETKNLTTRVVVPEEIRAFVKPVEIESEAINATGPNKNGVIIISGLREDVLSKKAEITADFESLASKLKTEVKAIPKKFHPLINAKDLLENFNVLVKFPTSETDENVSFVGLPKNVQEAIAAARTQSSSFAIDSLDISKAHGGNVKHANVLAAYFQHSGLLTKIGEEFSTSVRAPDYKKLAGNSSASVAIEITAPSSAPDSIKLTRKAIVDSVNALPPSRILFVTDISAFFAKRVSSVTAAAAKSSHVYVLPLSQLSAGLTDEIILIALKNEEEEFAPSQEEIDARLQNVNSALDELRSAQADLKSLTLDVPSDKQQFIEGPKGTTLKTLLASADDITIKLHSDGQNEAADKVFIQGSKDSVSKVNKEIDVLLKDAADLKDLYSYEYEIKIPVSVLSRLIGKSGANLASLREQFGVEVDVEKNPTSEKAAVTITGYKYNVKEAEQHIAQLSKKWADEVTKTLVVPKKYRSSLIGSSGKHVKKLETKYNVRINFSQSSDEVTIRGPSRGAAKAEEELKDLLDFEIENGYSKEIAVPQSAISRVIGRSGETINRIIVDAGIDINVNGEEKDSETRTITLTGSRKGLLEAEKQILAIVKEVENTVTVELEVDPKYFKDILGSKGSTKQHIIESAGNADDKDYRKLLQIPEAGSESNKIVSTGPKNLVDNIIAQVKKLIQDKENAVTEKVEVNKEKHRFIIGPSGSTRRSIEEEFNVGVSIPRADDKSESVTLTGLPEDIKKAKAKITELTADDWKAVVDVPAYLHGAISERNSFQRRVRLENNVEIEHGPATGRAHKLASKLPTPAADARGSDNDAVKFTVVEDDSSPDVTDSIPWRLKGDDEEVSKVEQQIKDAIKKHIDDNCTGFLWVKNSNAAFRKVIGPQGSRLNSIRKKTGAQIFVPRSTDKINDIITLRGTKASLEKAEKLLLSEIERK